MVDKARKPPNLQMSLGLKVELDSRYARSLISGSPRVLDSTFGRDSFVRLDWK
jgi:hypothetical protein